MSDEVIRETGGMPPVSVAPEAVEEMEGDRDLGSLSYRQLVWKRFRRSKLALIGSLVLFALYFMAIFAEFFAPYDALHDNMYLRYVPPQSIRFIAKDGFHLQPFVYGLKQIRNPETLE